MAEFRDVAPIFVTTDVARSMAHYRSLGFETETFGDIYGFISRDDVNLHVARVDDLDPRTSNVACFMFVADADQVHRLWSSSGADGDFRAPVDTDYGLREGAHIDPDGNLIRYGSNLDR